DIFGHLSSVCFAQADNAHHRIARRPHHDEQSIFDGSRSDMSSLPVVEAISLGKGYLMCNYSAPYQKKWL
ncbi:MAG: hypothetical protein Q9M26_07630, partial [Mariprofundales bacterium]|nr:hypothetical protein [Mariprofundales bacterium]